MTAGILGNGSRMYSHKRISSFTGDEGTVIKNLSVYF